MARHLFSFSSFLSQTSSSSPFLYFFSFLFSLYTRWSRQSRISGGLCCCWRLLRLLVRSDRCSIRAVIILSLSLFFFLSSVACVFRWLEEWEKIEKKTFLLYSLVSRMVCCLLRANRPPCSHDTVGRRQTNKTMTTEWERMRPNQLVCPRLGPIHRLGQFDASLVSTYVRTFEKNVIFRGGRSLLIDSLSLKENDNFSSNSLWTVNGIQIYWTLVLEVLCIESLSLEWGLALGFCYLRLRQSWRIMNTHPWESLSLAKQKENKGTIAIGSSNKR